MIFPLDELGTALYRRLKLEADRLRRLGVRIRGTQKLIHTYTELWLYYEAEELDDDADSVYNQKLRLERELYLLERQEAEQKEKVRSRCLSAS